jgi:hypothetical protein
MPPGTTAIGTTVRTAQARRTGVASAPKYAAMPPQTPPIFRSVRDRTRRRPEPGSPPVPAGTSSQAAAYASTPPMSSPGTIASTTHAMRTSATSVSKYSAIPAQIPPSRP